MKINFNNENELFLYNTYLENQARDFNEWVERMENDYGHYDNGVYDKDKVDSLFNDIMQRGF